MKNILIIDDDTMMLEILRDMLESPEYKVRVASNMVDASNLMMCRINIVILDLQGGDIDRKKIIVAAKRLKIDLITISGASELKPDLEKPFSRKQLIEEIEKLNSKKSS